MQRKIAAILFVIAVLGPAINAPARCEAVAPGVPPGEQADETCRKYLPSIGKTVAVPCEAGPDTTGVDPTAKLSMQRHSLRATLGRLPGEDPVPRGWLGVLISDLSPSLARIVELEHAKGVVTLRVIADGPAERAGLRPGDITLTVNGRNPENARGFAEIVKGMAPGSEVTLEVARFGQASGDLMRTLRARADAGSLDAMTALAGLLQTGDVKDEAEAAGWYRKAAERGDAQAMASLAFFYASGRGVTKDDAEAIRWYRSAAQLGNAQAMLSLALLYQEGRGVAKDDAEAAGWYRKAAEAGDAQAMASLGSLYSSGRGVAKDQAEAARWFRKGAEAGNVDAMSNLGTLYHNGWGVAQDPLQAAEWMFQALQKGHAPTVESLTTYRDAYSLEFRRALQRRLQEAGVFAGPVDGIFGPATLRAVNELAARSAR